MSILKIKITYLTVECFQVESVREEEQKLEPESFSEKDSQERVQNFPSMYSLIEYGNRMIDGAPPYVLNEDGKSVQGRELKVK